MEIEIIEEPKRSEELRKKSIKNNIEIKDMQSKLYNKFLKLDKETATENRLYLDKLIDIVINVAFIQGQSFGTEKIIYKEKSDANKGITSEQVYPTNGFTIKD